MTNILVVAALLALAAFWLVKLVRTFGWVEKRLLVGTKPWACNVCMSFWTTGACLMAVTAWTWPMSPVAAWLPAAGGGLALLESADGGAPPGGLT